jgi:protein SCO1/2
MNRTIAIAAGATIGCLLVGTFAVSYFGGAGRYAQCEPSAIGAEIGGPFELVNSAGETVTDRDVITEPALIYFGYTYCPDVCPLDVDRNAEAVALLDEQGISVTPIFITIDPARDTAQVVGEFAEAFHDRMIGLTGSPAQIKAASQAYRTYYKAHPAVDGEYLVDHSVFSYLVFPEVGFVEYFNRDLPPEQVAEKIGCFIETVQPETI